MTENNIEAKSQKLNYFIALLGVFAPAGYLIGNSFHHGTLQAYGISTDVFPLSTQDCYYTAYFAVGFLLDPISDIARNLMNWLFSLEGGVLSFALISLIMLFLYTYLKSHSLLKIKFVNNALERTNRVLSFLHWKNNDVTKVVGITGFASYLLLTIISFMMFLSVFWLAIPYAAYSKGLSISKEKRETFLNKGCFVEKGERFGNCRVLKSSDGTIIYEGLLIIHSKNMVAFLTKDGTFVSNMPNDAVIVSNWVVPIKKDVN